MANKISDETIEYVGILAKLELSGQEKEDAKADMEKMLDYIDTLNELDTDGIRANVTCISGEECIPGRCRDKWRRQCGDTGECTVGKRPELQSTKDDRIGGKRLWILQVLQQ